MALIHTDSCPKGRVFGIPSDHSKSIPEPSWKSPHARRQRSERNVHCDVHKDIHSVELLTLQASTHYHPLFQTGSSRMNGAEFGGGWRCDPVTSPDGYRLSGEVGTVDDSYIYDTHPGWYMGETQWSSLPGGEHAGALKGNLNYKISVAHLPHLSSSLLHLPLSLFLKPSSMKPPCRRTPKLWLKCNTPGPLHQTYQIRISQEEIQEIHILNKLYQWALSTKCYLSFIKLS